jgi:hypothetical protein
MVGTGSTHDRVRTLAILLLGVAPLALQAGPMVGGAAGARQVEKLLDEIPSDADVPQEVVLQCHLIGLVSEVVTLRGDHVDALSSSDGLEVDVDLTQPARDYLDSDSARPNQVDWVAPPTLLTAQPQGP